MTGRASRRKPDVVSLTRRAYASTLARHLVIYWGQTMAVLRDINTGQEYPLRGPSVTLGRSAECDIQISSPQVSARHALILCSNDAYYLTDVGSSNGTQINGTRVKGSTRLNTGDTIDLCGPSFTFAAEASSTVQVPAFALRDGNAAKSTVIQTLDVGAEARPDVSPEAKLRAILEMARNLGTTLDLNEVLPKILESLFALFPQTDRGFILLREPPGGDLVPRAVRHRNPNETARPSISRTIIDHVLQTGKAILSADAGMDERFEPSQSIRAHAIRSIMCVPMVGSGNTGLGVIQLDTRGTKNQFRQEDLEVLVSASFQAARAVDLARLHEVRRDLEAATRIQKSFLPAERPKVPGLEFFDYYAAAQHVGGDYYDYIRLPRNRLAVTLGDVAGKGVAAALLMAQLSAAARFSLATEATVAAAVRQLNQAMMRVCGDGRFVTFVVGVIDLATLQTTWVNAGHIPPLLRKANGDVQAVGEAQAGIPLGVFDKPIEEATLALQPGESIVLCTDGVTETKNTANDLYGMERLRAELNAAPADVEQLGLGVLTDVRRFAAGCPPHDDLTLVCFGRSAG
jgi:serine phosphatase RsbU (regulator of sigma subunit)